MLMLRSVRFSDALRRLPRGTKALSCSGVAHGFTAIELVGVLTVLSLLGLALIPQGIKRIDHAAWERESSDLNTIADSYIQSSLRNKTIPGTNTWASSVASYMSVPVTGITNTPRGLARAFLIDPNLR